MRLQLIGLGLLTSTFLGSFGFQLPAFATPAVLITQDVGSRVNIRSAPTTQSSIVHRGVTGDPVEILREAPGEDGFVWHYIKFTNSALVGWVRNDLLRIGTHSAPIREGTYWVGPIGMGLQVEGGRYEFYDESGVYERGAVDELQYVTDGVISDGGTYWCLSTLPSPNTSPISPHEIMVCSAKGWIWDERVF
ncbi:MAG: SH3 domain-containing protein [Cyanothece sp. SIO1E1]|nr:SH3 domain-containing protein [Cyanothece sp. SIO1E1]